MDLTEEQWDLLEELREREQKFTTEAVGLIRGVEISMAEAIRRMGEFKAGMQDALDQLICCWSPYPGHGDPKFFLGEVVWNQAILHDMSSYGGAVISFPLSKLDKPGPYHLVISLDED